MQIHELKRPIANRKAQQVGRGGKRGKTSGRGGKGQTARAGNKPRPQMRDIIKKLPKRRGMGKNSNKSIVYANHVQVVNISTLETTFDAGTVITRGMMYEKGLIKKSQGSLPTVKILGAGTVSKKFIFTPGIEFSASAKAAKKASKVVKKEKTAKKAKA